MLAAFLILTFAGAAVYVARALRAPRRHGRPRFSHLQARRLVGAGLLMLLMALMLAGTYLVSHEITPNLYVFLWASCMLLVVLLVGVAFWDLAEVSHDRKVQRLAESYFRDKSDGKQER